MGMFKNCTSLEEAVYLAVGASSVCWENMSGTGVFNDARAADIAKSLLSYFESFAHARVGSCWDVE